MRHSYLSSSWLFLSFLAIAVYSQTCNVDTGDDASLIPLLILVILIISGYRCIFADMQRGYRRRCVTHTSPHPGYSYHFWLSLYIRRHATWIQETMRHSYLSSSWLFLSFLAIAVYSQTCNVDT